MADCEKWSGDAETVSADVFLLRDGVCRWVLCFFFKALQMILCVFCGTPVVFICWRTPFCLFSPRQTDLKGLHGKFEHRYSFDFRHFEW